MANGRTTMRVLIVDDERPARDAIRIALADEPDVEIIGEAGTGADAVRSIESLDPDVVFLDIQMPGGGGFDVVERVGVERMPIVVFVTAYDEHALRAFDVHAMDYLLKPLERDRVARTISRVRERVRSMRVDARQPAFAAVQRDVRDVRDVRGEASGESRPAPRWLTRLVVRDDERTLFVRTADVDWFASDGNYVTIHVREQTYRLRVSLRDLVGQLDPMRFRRIHRSTIVNVDRIREVQPWFAGDHIAILHDGRQLRVSRTFAAGLLEPLQ